MVMYPFQDEGTPPPYNHDGVLWVTSVRGFARLLGVTVSDTPLTDAVQDDYIQSLDDEEDSLTGDSDER